MTMLIRSLLAIIFLLSSTLYAVEKQEVIKPETPTPNRNTQYPIPTQLDLIEKSVKENDYQTALFYLGFLTKKIRDMQSKELDKFFPFDFEGFRKKTTTLQPDEATLDENDYVLYKKVYQDSDGNTISIYVVSSDPIISDYMAMISSQKILKRFQNKRIIKVGTYNAIMTGSPGENYLEQNIVIDPNLLVNVFYVGKISNESAIKFASKMDLTHLAFFLIKK